MSDGNGDLRVLLVTPERKVLEESADSVALPAAEGYVTILPRHAPLIATLGVGVLTLRGRGRAAAYAIVGGFFEVSDDRVTVLADEAIAAEEVDTAASRRELEQARALLGTSAGEEQSRARRAIERAEAMLAVAAGPR
jgi:F-type H+-transporting ATPase subunit epsilon